MGRDLFAPDPLVFKKLIYEMRFDEASAKFAEFGPFYTGVHFSSSQLGAFLAGQVPALEEAPRTYAFLQPRSSDAACSAVRWRAGL